MAASAPDPGPTPTAFGSGIFIQGNNGITFSLGSGQTATVSDVITDQAGRAAPA
jgi:hypothetical protein